MNTAADIAAQAAVLIDGDREKTHGSKRENHQKVAAMWNAWLSIRRDPAGRLEPRDVAAMMALLKFARSNLGDYNADDGVDAVGYTAIFASLDAEDAFLTNIVD